MLFDLMPSFAFPAAQVVEASSELGSWSEATAGRSGFVPFHLGSQLGSLLLAASCQAVSASLPTILAKLCSL